VVNYLSIVTHFENFAKGVLDAKDIVFYSVHDFLFVVH